MYQGYSNGQQQKARRIIAAALAAGLVVSVSDGEGGWDLQRSDDEQAILAAIGEMDADELIFRTRLGHRIGWMLLVWGNAADGSELVSDYTANSEMEALAAA